MLDRGRGGEMSRQGSYAVVLGALSYLLASALVVNVITGWPAKRCIFSGIGLILLLLIGQYTGAFKRIAAPLAAKMSKQEVDPAPPVDIRTWRDFYGSMAGSGLAHGYIVTTSKFTKDAKIFVNQKTGNNILLIDQSDLMPWVERWLDRPIEIECSYCGVANRPEAKFCSSCGAPLG
ncbi:MAG: restriction endonuclease [Anaerolineales bacterium]|nr:restriction endonuclease [Anaerolineales bacterium]